MIYVISRFDLFLTLKFIQSTNREKQRNRVRARALDLQISYSSQPFKERYMRKLEKNIPLQKLFFLFGWNINRQNRIQRKISQKNHSISVVQTDRQTVQCTLPSSLAARVQPNGQSRPRATFLQVFAARGRERVQITDLDS